MTLHTSQNNFAQRTLRKTERTSSLQLSNLCLDSRTAERSASAILNINNGPVATASGEFGNYVAQCFVYILAGRKRKGGVEMGAGRNGSILM